MNLHQSFSSIGRCLILTGNDGKTYVWGSLDSHTNTYSPEELTLVMNEHSEPVHTDPPNCRDTGDIVGVAAGNQHVLILMKDGSVLASGLGYGKQLGIVGIRDTGPTWVHVPLPPEKKAIQVGCGPNCSACVMDDGSVWTWGTLSFLALSSPPPK